jgi:hypothetical protein
MKTLCTFEVMPAVGVPTAAVVQVVADIWSVIDAAHRMRLLVNFIPLVTKKDLAIRTFMDATAPIEELRRISRTGMAGALVRLEVTRA